MCPLLSCCHGRSTSPLSTPLYRLLRLLLAGDTPQELAPAEQAGLYAQLAARWDTLHVAVQAYYRTSAARARELTEQLLMSLLLEDCCRRSLRRAVPLAEALGLAQGVRWGEWVPA